MAWSLRTVCPLNVSGHSQYIAASSIGMMTRCCPAACPRSRANSAAVMAWAAAPAVALSQMSVRTRSGTGYSCDTWVDTTPVTHWMIGSYTRQSR